MAEVGAASAIRGRAARRRRELPPERELTWRDALKDARRGLFDVVRSPWSALALARVPRGDGHAVLVLPGFLATDYSTAPLRAFLARLGYRTFPWALGVNFGFSPAYEYDIEVLIEHRLKEVLIESGDRKISLIGWSLGGLYAKALARRYPHLIRDVVTLGSPISGHARDASVWRLYERVSAVEFHDPEVARKLRELNAPLEGVPLTAFYSRNDGIVPWQACCEPPGPLVQNIETPCAHLGMGFDSFNYYLIAHRLARSEQQAWAPLDVRALRRRFERDRRPWPGG
jgi:pimeloyl-ACP methyl ester carboxylesterase